MPSQRNRKPRPTASQRPVAPTSKHAMQAQLAMRLRRWHANHNSFCAIPTEALLREAQALDDARADLPHFAAYGMAVTAHHFDALAVLTAALEHCAQQRLVNRAVRIEANKSWNLRRRGVRAQLSAIGARARLFGMPRALAGLGRATGNPLWQVEAARRQLGLLREWLQRLVGGGEAELALLEQALADAGAAAERLHELAVTAVELRSNEAALRWLLREELLVLARWGTALAAASGEALGSYGLKRLRGPRRKKKDNPHPPSASD